MKTPPACPEGFLPKEGRPVLPQHLLYVLYGYLILVNLLAFAAMGVDKRRAGKKEWRIPEASLLALAFLGGALGGTLGMLLFHHKTRHPKFTVLLPLFLLLQAAALWWFLLRDRFPLPFFASLACSPSSRVL